MFQVEIKINSHLVTHVYGYNTGEVTENGEHLYFAQVYSVLTGNVREVRIKHYREDGIDKLVRLILGAAEKKT